MASGGRGTSSAEQIFGLTSLWPQRPLEQKMIFAYWAASPAQGEALGYCGIWHVQAHAFSASTCSHSRRRHGYVRDAIYIFRTSLSLPRARQNASLQHAGAIVASHSMHAPLASDAPLTKATLHAATFPHAGAALFAGATLQAGNNARSTCIITIDLE